MRRNIPPALALLLLAGVLGTVSFLVHRARYRFVRNRSDLVRRLPAADATTFFADVHLLREAGLLGVLAGSRANSEPEYQRFVRQTGFDYSRDLDAVAGAYQPGRLSLLLQGRFDWHRLRSYPSTHGGACSNAICRVPGTSAGRWISFAELQPDVLALSVSTSPQGVSPLLKDAALSSVVDSPQDPIWLQPAHSLFQNPAALPAAARIFAIALQSADQVVLSATEAQSPDDAFLLRLQARFANGAMADTARAQFDLDTRLLRAELAREHAAPDSADLSGLLTSGFFQAAGDRLTGKWAVKQKLMQTLR